MNRNICMKRGLNSKKNLIIISGTANSLKGFIQKFWGGPVFAQWILKICLFAKNLNVSLLVGGGGSVLGPPRTANLKGPISPLLIMMHLIGTVCLYNYSWSHRERNFIKNLWIAKFKSRYHEREQLMQNQFGNRDTYFKVIWMKELGNNKPDRSKSFVINSDYKTCKSEISFFFYLKIMPRERYSHLNIEISWCFINEFSKYVFTSFEIAAILNTCNLIEKLYLKIKYAYLSW